jgi:hypothetical protein
MTLREMRAQRQSPPTSIVRAGQVGVRVAVSVLYEREKGKPQARPCQGIVWIAFDGTAEIHHRLYHPFSRPLDENIPTECIEPVGFEIIGGVLR